MFPVGMPVGGPCRSTFWPECWVWRCSPDCFHIARLRRGLRFFSVTFVMLRWPAAELYSDHHIDCKDDKPLCATEMENLAATCCQQITTMVSTTKQIKAFGNMDFCHVGRLVMFLQTSSLCVMCRDFAPVGNNFRPRRFFCRARASRRTLRRARRHRRRNERSART